ncbi:hypothetical protein SBA4_260005 [Candidatus Sulfopaludibacter sp. SbA4]|nr:hypothetical protein SBA4_260005 [Candidatus Sulfopaludibacter sp. SbA4]
MHNIRRVDQHPRFAFPSHQQRIGEGIAETIENENWLPVVDTFRTLVLNPLAFAPGSVPLAQE